MDACRWVTSSVPYAPYVTSLPWISHYGCQYVVHGDDITSDSSGEDCYRFVKAAGRFKVVKRTPAISTTDLVGRMLLCTKAHFIKSFQNMLSGSEGPGTAEERKLLGRDMMERIRVYASDASGLHPGSDVWFWNASKEAREDHTAEEKGSFDPLIRGSKPKPGQRVVYVDGGFDLFSSGHIEFLRQVIKTEEELAMKEGWFETEATEERKGKGDDYGPVFVVAGVHDDEVINDWKGVNYPIMNIFERGLCVLQCKVCERHAIRPNFADRYKYIHAVIFGAPFTPTKTYLTSLPWGTPDAVYHGPTSFMPLTYDPYAAAKELDIYKEIGTHDFADVNAEQIVQRILKSRAMYEERQRLKGIKAVGEEGQRMREKLEEEQRLKEHRKV